jgi:hypothetical protein
MPETEPELLSLSLKLWHPGCWTTEVTTATGASVLGHGSVVSDTGVWERCTLTGQSPEHVEQAVAVARESSRIGGLEPLGDRPGPCERSGSAVDTYAQDVVIEYDYSEGIGPALSARGFVLDGVSRMEGGTETWPLLVHGCRSRLQDVLDGIRSQQDATISVERVECAGAGRRETPVEARLDELTTRGPRRRASSIRPPATESHPLPGKDAAPGRRFLPSGPGPADSAGRERGTGGDIPRSVTDPPAGPLFRRAPP